MTPEAFDDVVALQTCHVQAAVIPTRVAVTMFGVDCSDRHVGFARREVVGPVDVVPLPINPKMVAAAAALAAGLDPGELLAAESSFERLGQSRAAMFDQIDNRQLRKVRHS